MKLFSEAKGGACSLWGVGAAWRGCSLGKYGAQVLIGGVQVKHGRCRKSMGVQIVAMGVQVLTWGSSMGGAVQA